jgi:hypothetical protein
MDAQCKCPKCGHDWIFDVPTGERRAKLWEGIDPAITANIADWHTAKEWQACIFWYSDLSMPAPAVCFACGELGHMRKVQIERDISGAGPATMRGDTVSVRYQMFLNHGGLIQSHTATFTIGQRRFIAGLEYGVEGMQVGGRRRFRVGPHLAYGDVGVEGLVPRDAVLILDVELLDIQPDQPTAS